jgi:hypothetical protein
MRKRPGLFFGLFFLQAQYADMPETVKKIVIKAPV